MYQIKLIIGLGNPGNQYVNTRHNIGFLIIDEYTTSLELSWKKDTYGYRSEYIDKENNKKIIFAKPSTFMNLSGDYVNYLIKYFKVNVENILIIVDDCYLKLGEVRLRETGSAGGHNGLKHIFKTLNTNNIYRLRIGIGAAEINKLVLHVLGILTSKEQRTIFDNYSQIEEQIKNFIKK